MRRVGIELLDGLRINGMNGKNGHGAPPPKRRSDRRPEPRGMIRVMAFRRTLALGVVLCLASCSDGGADVAQASTPMPTMDDFRARRAAFVEATFVEHFKQTTDQTADWYPRALACIEDTAAWLSGAIEREPKAEIVRRLREVMRESDPDFHPLLIFSETHLIDDRRKSTAAMNIMGQNDAPVQWQFVAACDAGSMHAADLCVALVTENPFGADGSRYLWWTIEEVIENAPLPHVTQICDVLQGLAGVDPWLLNLCRGMERLRANQVTEAYRHFAAAYETHPERPEAATRLIEVACLGGAPQGETPRLWFDRAVAAQFDWFDAYIEMLIGLDPQNGGTLDGLYEFGLECAATKRYDTQVPFMLVQACIQIADWQSELAFWYEHDAFTPLQALCAAYAEREPVAYGQDATYWTAWRGVLASRTGDWALAREQFESIDWRIPREVSVAMWVRPVRIREETYLYTSAIGPQVLEGEAADARGDHAAARDLYAAALEACPKDLAWHVRQRLAASEFGIALAGGDWVDILFDDDLSGWERFSGSWERYDDTTVAGNTHDNGMIMFHRHPVGPRWEIEGTIIAPYRSSITRPALLFNARYDFGRPDFEAVAYWPLSERVALQRSDREDERIERVVDVPQKFKFRVIVWDDQVAAWCKDELVYAGAAPGTGPRWVRGAQLGLGGLYRPSEKKVQFTDMRIRRIDERPAALP